MSGSRLSAVERAGVVAAVRSWYAEHARDLPWRRPGTGAWAVLVSEVMLQQTPVVRVLGPYRDWLDRWPTPAHLAAEESAAAVAAWGRLGYPRRARRLWEAARIVTGTHGGVVPADVDTLRTLPGVGHYTAAAVSAFAYGRRTVVLDTNVRRVLARIDDGREHPGAHLSAAERARAEAWVPTDAAAAVAWSAAAMELGALVCTAVAPGCAACPVAASCAWLAAGRPPAEGPRRTQAWQGTDRQCRGVLLDALRTGPSPMGDLLARWPDPDQARRCLDGLRHDRLARIDGDVVRL